jgi:hypothetical protein
MPIRVAGAPSIASSGGAVMGPSETTIPSAGLMTNPARVGVTRHGSRKKYAIHTVTISASHPAGCHSRKSTMVTAAPIATNFHPSGWIGARVWRSIFRPSLRGARKARRGNLLPQRAKAEGDRFAAVAMTDEDVAHISS